MSFDFMWTESFLSSKLRLRHASLIPWTYIHVSQPSSVSSFSSSSSRDERLVAGSAVVATFGFLVALGAFGFFVGFGALGFLVGFGAFGFFVGFGAFCFFALASFSAAFFALASEKQVQKRNKHSVILNQYRTKEGMKHTAALLGCVNFYCQVLAFHFFYSLLVSTHVFIETTPINQV